ncbi:hypothetical protein HZH68_008197 [Vespula germanica]|uniref:Uncharacterized protein n=1 Tax=Vespula germanica TaxID=30212 RepID=A0A834N8F1_VESGE|nr:hypothetical protein HZH68_008197 [Vespula germanica]
MLVAGNGNVLGSAMTNTTATRTSTPPPPMMLMTEMAMVRPLDIQLPPTLPMTFATKNSSTISAQSGSTALLPCVVHNLGDGVSTLESSLYSFNDVAAHRFVDRYSKCIGKSNPALAKIDHKVLDWDPL